MKQTYGYTLLEMLVALVIFGIITLATGTAMRAALVAQTNTRQTIDEQGEVNALFSVLSHDLRMAYASQGNTQTLFVLPGAQDGVLLTFSSLSHRLISRTSSNSSDTSYNSPSTVMPTTGNVQETAPQSDMSLIRYHFSMQTHELRRAESATPSLDTLPWQDEAGTGSASITASQTVQDRLLSGHVAALTFTCTDPMAGDRTEWNYMVSANVSSSTGGSIISQGSALNDTYLPVAVKITATMIKTDGSTRDYSTSVALAMAQPQPKGQVPAAPATARSGNGQ